jgi:hypothetical protein
MGGKSGGGRPTYPGGRSPCRPPARRGPALNPLRPTYSDGNHPRVSRIAAWRLVAARRFFTLVGENVRPQKFVSEVNICTVPQRFAKVAGYMKRTMKIDL